MAQSDDSLPYHEPSIETILILASFLLLLNGVNHVLNKLIYCGLLGQVLIGVIWGTPLAKWLESSFEHAAVQLGYLGLLLLVYEGGLSTSFAGLKANLPVSIAVAATGIAIPIGASFSLGGITGATPLQSFAAGASLCSTSLGTTFTVLKTSGLTSSRLGVVLSSAAMMDDVVGLVLVQVISNLGGASTSIDTVTVVRPIVVSIGFAIAVLLVCRFVVRPLGSRIRAVMDKSPESFWVKVLHRKDAGLAINIIVLIGMIAGATYAGTSSLFAAYLAGAASSWWDSEAGPDIFATYYAPVVEGLLVPPFFASIGFSIPVKRVFAGHIVWRGLVYSALMTVSKLVCGIWLFRFQVNWPVTKLRPRNMFWNTFFCCFKKRNTQSCSSRAPSAAPSTNEGNNPSTKTEPVEEVSSEEGVTNRPNQPQTQQQPSPKPSSKLPKPRSLYPASILGWAMVSRGEIGFLISSLAESRRIFGANAGSDKGGSSDIYLVVTWAITLCTVIGPISVGLLVRRVKRLQERREREQTHGTEDPLGIWGLNSMSERPG